MNIFKNLFVTKSISTTHIKFNRCLLDGLQPFLSHDTIHALLLTCKKSLPLIKHYVIYDVYGDELQSYCYSEILRRHLHTKHEKIKISFCKTKNQAYNTIIHNKIMHNVYSLDLSHTNIDVLPKSLKLVRWINISECKKVRDISFLEKVEKLDISHSSLRYVPYFPNLKILIIHNDQIFDHDIRYLKSDLKIVKV